MRRWLRDRRGAAAVEFALLGSALLLLLVGGIEVGLVWWTYNGLQLTASLTARCAAIGSCTDPASFAVSAAGQWTLTGAITPADVTVSTGDSTCFGNSDGYSAFTKVTIKSELWNQVLVGPLANIRLQASACYPNPEPS
jgi:Flp pilus assembly protein TadG